MKKIIISLMALAIGAMASAKTADDLRVYINPGHGSWTANDRPQTIIGHEDYNRYGTDTTNFFESNTNLRKGFGVLEKLRAYGLKYDPTLNQTGERYQIGAARDMSNNIVMSHVKCGPYHDDNGTKNQLGDQTPEDIEYYNRNLTEICEEVEANNFDMFISIHSNAASGTTNYPLFLYRGYDTPQEGDGLDVDHQTTSRAMADACWGYAFENPHMVWTYYSMTNKNVRGDVNFYGSGSTGKLGYYGYLGVLKHSAPGFLVEGYFHTYNCARHRAMNWDVDYMEGAAYAHGIADHFQLTKESTGDIYGIVRDLHERFNHTLYSPNTASLDRFLPLNGCKVILNKDGQKVAEYTTDNNYNGVFVFKDVEPGKYTLTFEDEQYKAGDPVEVEVKAATISYPTAQLENIDYVAPTVNYQNYPDPMAECAAVFPADSYTFAAEYTDEPIEGLEGKIIRRAIVRDGKMYVLALDKQIVKAANIPVEEQPVPTIIVYDLAKKEILANVSAEGATGSIAAIADIQVTADGYLLACNATKNQFSDDYIETGDAGRGTFTIYKWENDETGIPTGAPAAWITTQSSGLWFRAYPSGFSYSGTTEEGMAIVAMPTVTETTQTARATYIGVIEGAKAAENDFRSSANVTKFVDLGADMTYMTSPLNDEQLIMIDSKKGAQSWEYAAAFDVAPLAVGNETFANADGRSGMFKYAGASYVVMPLNEEGNNNGLQLINITADLANAKATSIVLGEPLAAVETAQTAAMGEVQVTRDEYSNAVTNGWINLYLLRDGKITKITTNNVKQPQNRKEFAYNLNAVENEDNYTITFDLSGNVEEANIILTPEEGEPFVINLGAQDKGNVSYTLDMADLPTEGKYSWAVEVVSAPIAQAGEVFADPAGITVRGGAIAITDPEYDSFGYVAVGHGANKGIDIYDPTGEKVADRVFTNHAMFGAGTTNQSNPFRGDQLNGKAVFATWGDAGYGAVAVNPIDTEEEPFTLFAGDKQGSGNFVYDGTNLGGGTAGITFITDGDETYMMSFSEDHEGSNGGGATENTLVRYHMSSPWQITEAPVSLGYKALLLNTNVDLLAYGKGVFAAQVRGAGNNQAGTPCFAYIANVLGDNHELAMTSAGDDIRDYIDDSTAGIAITTDGKTIAASLKSSIVIFDVIWEEEIYPVLTYKYSFPITTSDWAHLRFDAAGNLHAYLRGSGYHVFSLPAERPVATTAAKAENFIGKETGITTISAEQATEGNAVYYNLQGVKVPTSNLTPGVYVKVQGNKASKVLVK